VDSFGNNKAWTGRVSSLSDPYETPAFFGSSYNTAMNKYGRNRDVIPYGAATIPDNYDFINSGQIYFKNQYSKKDGETVFAGRPYGCNSNKSQCQYLGYCSLDPNVYCLLDSLSSTNQAGSGTNIPGNISQLSCSDGRYGTCLPLWDKNQINSINPGATSNGMAILKNIFLKYYGQLHWNKSESVYELSGNFQDYSANTSLLTSTRQGHENEFAHIYPLISNIKLNNTAIDGQSASYKAQVGINVLTFNTAVDLEQQPLKEIYIDWGDGTIQTIVGQDNRPGEDSPHMIYHYYDHEISNPGIKIEIVDNWGFYSYFKGQIRGSID
jgi:hypothetical protein